MQSTMLQLRDVVERHPGLTAKLWGALYEAACVCLDRHHQPPRPFGVRADGDSHEYVLQWEVSSDSARRAHGNELDATEQGAYAICVACVERSLALVVAGRAEHATGADWYLIPAEHARPAYGLPDLDDPSVRRLEVSGVDTGPIGSRMRQKKEQVHRGASEKPGIAGVVGFQRARVEIESVDGAAD